MTQSAQVGSKRALIIGCGIAGPVLAMFLKRAGLLPEIFEGRSAPSDEAGAFLNLAPNGAAILRTLGIDEDVLGYGTPTTKILFQNHRAKRLGLNPEQTTLIKRGLLNRGLREAAVNAGVPLHFGKRLVDIEQRNGKVKAVFEDGTSAEGDLIVGCDGIHSRTRRVAVPEAPDPSYTGIIDCGAFTRTSAAGAADGIMRMTFGLKGFFGYQVVPSGEVYWFENYPEDHEPDRDALDAIPQQQWRDRLLAMHGDDHHPVAEIIRSTEGPIGRWPIYDMQSIPRWQQGLICLIGDAAHATSPHVGQGASMAMEDAIVLAKCLRDVPDTRAAFATFENLRRERVERVVKEARRTGNQKAPSGAIGRAIRDLVLPFFLKMGVKATEPVYSYRVDWTERVTADAGTR